MLGFIIYVCSCITKNDSDSETYTVGFAINYNTNGSTNTLSTIANENMKKQKVNTVQLKEPPILKTRNQLYSSVDIDIRKLNTNGNVVTTPKQVLVNAETIAERCKIGIEGKHGMICIEGHGKSVGYRNNTE